MYVTCMVYFDLLVVKVIFGSFGALVSKCPVTQKCVAIEIIGSCIAKRSGIWEVWVVVTFI